MDTLGLGCLQNMSVWGFMDFGCFLWWDTLSSFTNEYHVSCFWPAKTRRTLKSYIGKLWSGDDFDTSLSYIIFRFTAIRKLDKLGLSSLRLSLAVVESLKYGRANQSIIHDSFWCHDDALSGYSWLLMITQTYIKSRYLRYQYSLYTIELEGSWRKNTLLQTNRCFTLSHWCFLAPYSIPLPAVVFFGSLPCDEWF